MSLNNWRADARLTERIRGSVLAGNVFHAYIIEGDTCVDKVAFAKDMLKAIICRQRPGVGCDDCIDCRKIDHDNYEDLYFVESDGLSVKDDAVFQLQEKLKLKPAGGSRNLAIIKDADTMTLRAQNRLLKTLEEPPAGTVILLLSENKDNLLETIRSRCVAYRLNSLETDLNQLQMEGASAIMEALLEGESFFRMKELLNQYMKSRDDAFQLLDGMERIYRDFLVGKDLRGRLLKRENIFRHIELIEEARRDLVMKVNHNYAMKNLIIKIGG
ncbi:MAG: DNA polymerase III subunit [Firmicutes bacterium]|nr:DNA polymerase III subunit [Bacillota bacterium]